MRLLAINGSPRKNWNTAQLLEQVVAGAKTAGADAELVHLRDLKYTGCVSCFSCKKIGGPSYGRCVLQDELRPVLDKAHEADVLVLGSPFYFSTESAFMRAFEERLWFQYHLYSNIKPSMSPRKKATALIYTMNVRQEEMPAYGKDRIVATAKRLMEHMFAPCEVLLSCDTLQFDDYSRYDTDRWDAKAKQERHNTVFQQELKDAHALGQRLVSQENHIF
ncbi:MAG: flavodoxin family protein [Desulfovibrio sp.]|nr:flavodoxin family protein [Desulfovibrio sp.]